MYYTPRLGIRTPAIRTKTLARGHWLRLRSETLTAPGGPGGPRGALGALGGPGGPWGAQGSGSSENVCKSAKIRSIWDQVLGPREPGVQISGKPRELEGLRTVRKTLKRNLRALFQQKIRVEFDDEIRTPKTLRRN